MPKRSLDTAERVPGSKVGFLVFLLKEIGWQVGIIMISSQPAAY